MTRVSGYGTPISQAELRATQLAILDRVDAYCRRTATPYALCGGTLLGAVRHGGYIPWDDDIDLMMPREAYDSFARGLMQAPEGRGLQVHAVGMTPGWPYPYIKVSDTSTIMVEEARHSVDLGVNIDVFPLDGLARRPWVRRFDDARVWLLRGVATLLSLAPREGRAAHKRAFIRLLQAVLAWLPQPVVVRRWDAACRRRPLDVDGDIGVRAGFVDWEVPYDRMLPAADIDFEGRSCRAPADASYVLTATFGDFMTLPPVEQQVSTHRYHAYRK